MPINEERATDNKLNEYLGLAIPYTTKMREHYVNDLRGISLKSTNSISY